MFLGMGRYHQDLKIAAPYSRALETYPRVLEARPGATEVHLGVSLAHPGALVAHLGAMEAHSWSREGSPWSFRGSLWSLAPLSPLRLSVISMDFCPLYGPLSPLRPLSHSDD